MIIVKNTAELFVKPFRSASNDVVTCETAYTPPPDDFKRVGHHGLADAAVGNSLRMIDRDPLCAREVIPAGIDPALGLGQAVTDHKVMISDRPAAVAHDEAMDFPVREMPQVMAHLKRIPAAFPVRGYLTGKLKDLLGKSKPFTLPDRRAGLG